MWAARLACVLPLLWFESARSWKPHVVFILADDYGWANMGKHRKHPQGAAEAQGRSETHTPHLDQLIREGVLLERHYAYKICSPSRSSLQSGRLAVHVNTVNTGVTFWNPEDNVSGFAGVPANMTGLAEKMQDAGYRTHLVGKWDAGMATPLHTPLGKGYDSWLGYFQHANDYWQESMPFTSTGNVDICLNKFRDFSLYNGTYRAGVTEAVARELGCNASVKHKQTTGIKPQVNATGCNKDDPDYCLPDECFEEAMFNQYALRIIREHDRLKPLFLFYSFHLLHTPLQIPESYLHEIDRIVAQSGVPQIIPWTQNRRLYAAMTLYMDTMVGNLISALKKRQMYEDTLIVFTSDNGGPVYEPGSANNWPLKGGKYSDWEGGVRTNAFVSGGFVPWARRGTKFGGVISIADWYATLSTIVGVPVHDEKAEQANRYLVQNDLPLLPPVDGRPQWENIVWDINGRKDALHLSQEALLWWPFKLVTGQQVYSFYQGPVYPNCTTVEGFNADEGPIFSDMHVFGVPLYASVNATQQDELTMASDCGYGGCLFNVERDPNEVQDLAADPVYSDVLFQMQKKLYYLNEGNFNPNRGEPAVEACLQAADLGGFYGPFVEVDDFYKGVNLTEEQKILEAANKEELLQLNETLQKEGEKYVIEFSEEYGLIDLFRPGPNNSIDVCMNDTGSTAVSTSAASPRRYYKYYRRSWKCVWGKKWRCWGLFCCNHNRRCLPRQLCRQPSSSSPPAAQLSGTRASEMRLITDGRDASQMYKCEDICHHVCEIQHSSPARCPHLCNTRLDAVLQVAQVFCIQGLCSSVISNQTHEEAGLLQKRVRRTDQVFSEETEVGCQQPAKYCRLFCKQGVLLENTIQQCLAGCQAKFPAVLAQMQAFVRGGCCEARDA